MIHHYYWPLRLVPVLTLWVMSGKFCRYNVCEHSVPQHCWGRLLCHRRSLRTSKLNRVRADEQQITLQGPDSSRRFKVDWICSLSWKDYYLWGTFSKTWIGKYQPSPSSPLSHWLFLHLGNYSNISLLSVLWYQVWSVSLSKIMASREFKGGIYQVWDCSISSLSWLHPTQSTFSSWWLWCLFSFLY